jgi:hypothetical protein
MKIIGSLKLSFASAKISASRRNTYINTSMVIILSFNYHTIVINLAHHNCDKKINESQAELTAGILKMTINVKNPCSRKLWESLAIEIQPPLNTQQKLDIRNELLDRKYNQQDLNVFTAQ